MKTTAVDDLAAWLTQIGDEDEKAAQRAVGDVATMEIDNYGHLTMPASWVLARIAADRQILALHEAEVTKLSLPPFDPHTGEPRPEEFEVNCHVCGWASDDPTSACETVRLLALPHADRPGYRQEWKP